MRCVEIEELEASVGEEGDEEEEVTSEDYEVVLTDLEKSEDTKEIEEDEVEESIDEDHIGDTEGERDDTLDESEIISNSLEIHGSKRNRSIRNMNLWDVCGNRRK